jgi:hypothetical protein
VYTILKRYLTPASADEAADPRAGTRPDDVGRWS